MDTILRNDSRHFSSAALSEERPITRSLWDYVAASGQAEVSEAVTETERGGCQWQRSVCLSGISTTHCLSFVHSALSLSVVA